ncbi:MAG: iron-containing alcohol dehydrogenase [Bacteroidota bacterium]
MNTSTQILRGRNLLLEVLTSLDSYAVLLSELDWDMIAPLIEKEPLDVISINSREESQLEIHADNLPACEYILGIGGLNALEAAKFAAFQRNIKLILLPLSLARSSYADPAIRVLNYDQEKIIGELEAEKLLIDFQLLEEIPPDIHAEGLAEIFSIQTACFDWEHARNQGQSREHYSHKAIDDARAILSDIEMRVSDISMGSEKGLDALVDAQISLANICRDTDNARVKGGSEHIFKILLEEQLKQNFEAAGLLALSTLLMARLQNNKAGELLQMLKASGIFFQPSELGIQAPHLLSVLQDLRYFVQRRQGLVYTCLNDAYIDEEWVYEMIQDLEF